MLPPVGASDIGLEGRFAGMPIASNDRQSFGCGGIDFLCAALSAWAAFVAHLTQAKERCLSSRDVGKGAVDCGLRVG